MKEKRHVCFGGALTKGKKLKYITYLVLKSYASQASVIFVKHNYFFCLWRKHQSALAAGKTKKINNIRVEKVPTWLWCQCDFPKVIKHPSLSICYFLFWSYLIYAFYFFSLAVVAIFRFCHRRTYCCWRNGFFYRKIKSLPLIFFLFFRFFNFSSQKVRYSCVLLAWIVNIPFHHIVPARISKPTLWVADINYWIKWKVVKKVSRLRLYEEDSKLTFW